MKKLLLPVLFIVLAYTLSLCAKPCIVESISMNKTLEEGDLLLGSYFSYIFSKPKVSDIAAFEIYVNGEKRNFIKRVAGVPGDTIKEKGGLLYNGEVVVGKAINKQKDITLKEGEYYMLGDNSDHSLDSRFFGPVPEKNIQIKIFLRIYPNPVSLDKEGEEKNE